MKFGHSSIGLGTKGFEDFFGSGSSRSKGGRRMRQEVESPPEIHSFGLRQRGASVAREGGTGDCWSVGSHAKDPEKELRRGDESSHRSENGDKAEVEPRRVASLGRKAERIGSDKGQHQAVATHSPETPPRELRHSSPPLPHHRRWRSRSSRGTPPTTRTRTASRDELTEQRRGGAEVS
jgi:hypothetical protein